MDPEKPLPGRWAKGWRDLAADLAAEAAAEAIAQGLPPPKVWRPPPPQPAIHRADVARRAGLDPHRLAELRAELQAREWERRRALAARRNALDPAGDGQAVPLEQDYRT